LRFAVCLHGAGVVRSSRRLHPTDRHAIALGLAMGGEIVVIEAVGERGSAPIGVSDALNAGCSRAVRLVEPTLATSDAHATGFALASVLDHLKVDVVLCGGDADPEGIGDVPAHVAIHMGALYITNVVDLTAAGRDTLAATLSCGPWLRRLALPLNAVLVVAASREPHPLANGPRPKNAAAIEIMTLADLGIDVAVVRRQSDLRGVIEAATRPLVTLHSAEAVGALLRRS
jgi:electron transfer flavoprotein beta subunit